MFQLWHFTRINTLSLTQSPRRYASQGTIEFRLTKRQNRDFSADSTSRTNRYSRGAASLELALFTPILIVLIFGMLEASRMCMVAQLLTNAAREGCRVAAANGSVTADVYTRVQATLDATDPNLYPLVTMSLSPSPVESATGNTSISLTLSVAFSDVNWLSSPFFFRSSTIQASAVMLSQRP